MLPRRSLLRQDRQRFDEHGQGADPNVYSDADGRKCSDLDSTKRCGDHLFKSVSGLKTTWEQYEVKFAELTQQAFGLPQASFDPTSVYSVQFTLANKLPIDLWIDDVTFVAK